MKRRPARYSRRVKVLALPLLAAVAACWTERAPSAPHSSTSERAPRSPLDLPPPSRPPQRYTKFDVGTLERDLRGDASADVFAGMAGPVVVGDLDAGTVDTLCGDQVVKVVQQFAQLLTDPARPPLTCTLTPNEMFACQQLEPAGGARTWLFLLFANDGELDLKSAVRGTLSTMKAGMPIVMQVRDRTRTATCP